MQEKRFHREEYPLDILAEFGLTEEMIYDLPDFVHETIEMGGKSPLLPISIEQPFGLTHAFAKFSLTETEQGIDALFFPKLKSINLEQFSEHDKKLLLDGKVIVTDIEESNSNGEAQRIKSFVQIDKDTNDVVYTPTAIIGRNLSSVAAEYELNGDQLKQFWTGNLVTVKESNDQGTPEPVTIGIDLFTDKGVIVIPGTAEQWEKTVRKVMPEYTFGNDGCWVNRKGELQYVPEEHFTKDIWDMLEQNVKTKEISEAKEHNEHHATAVTIGQEQEESRQLTR